MKYRITIRLATVEKARTSLNNGSTSQEIRNAASYKIKSGDKHIAIIVIKKV